MKIAAISVAMFVAYVLGAWTASWLEAWTNEARWWPYTRDTFREAWRMLGPYRRMAHNRVRSLVYRLRHGEWPCMCPKCWPEAQEEGEGYRGVDVAAIFEAEETPVQPMVPGGLVPATDEQMRLWRQQTDMSQVEQRVLQSAADVEASFTNRNNHLVEDATTPPETNPEP